MGNNLGVEFMGLASSPVVGDGSRHFGLPGKVLKVGVTPLTLTVATPRVYQWYVLL